MITKNTIAYDYSKLNGKITEICKTQYVFAERMGWSERTATFKMNNISCWKQSDIEKAIAILRIDREDIITYFFTPIQ